MPPSSPLSFLFLDGDSLCLLSLRIKRRENGERVAKLQIFDNKGAIKHTKKKESSRKILKERLKIGESPILPSYSA